MNETINTVFIQLIIPLVYFFQPESLSIVNFDSYLPDNLNILSTHNYIVNK